MGFSKLGINFVPVEMSLEDDSLNSLRENAELQRKILDSGSLQVSAVNLLFSNWGKTTVVLDLSKFETASIFNFSILLKYLIGMILSELQ